GNPLPQGSRQLLEIEQDSCSHRYCFCLTCNAILWELACRRLGCKAPSAANCYLSNNNPLRQFVFFSYNFPYILPAAS
ncbi:hypothetical protein, partial [Pseudomonas putida]|uniref:hypothetical protein n=1 Tax=Pseudomonas putida TaxID=303 RepID=UPI002AC6B62C